MRRNGLRPGFIVAMLVCMLPAIDFNHESFGGAREIRDIRSDWDLTAELHAI